MSVSYTAWQNISSTFPMRKSQPLPSAQQMLTQLFLAAKLIGERALPFVARMVKLGGLNDVARELNAISPALAQKFLDAPYHPEKDYEDNK